MRFALFGNTYETCKSVHAEQLFAILSSYGDEVYVDRDFCHFLCEEQRFAFQPAGIIDHLDNLDVDMAISLGGDGTFLKAARCVGATRVPIVGINTGRLGFLADVSADEMEFSLPSCMRDATACVSVACSSLPRAMMPDNPPMR